MMLRAFVLAAGTVGIAYGSATAQTINIDVGVFGDAPPATFAGAGSAGEWNVYTALPGPPLALVDVNGAPTSATLSTFGTSEAVTTGTVAGDEGALVNDLMGTFNSWGAFIEGLEPGIYDLIFYSLDTTTAQVETVVTVTGVGGRTLGGGWPGSLVENSTHAIYRKQVNPGETVEVQFDPAGGIFNQSPAAVLNGIQIVFIGPPCTCELTSDSTLDVFDLLAYLDLWFAEDPGAERDGTDGIDVFDLLSYLDCWFAGC